MSAVAENMQSAHSGKIGRAVLGLHQESLARLARLGSVGELAAAVAHELNQPLMAAVTYTRLVADALSTGHGNPDEVAETARKAAAQVERAAAVMKRLRAIARLDRSNLISTSIHGSPDVKTGPAADAMLTAGREGPLDGVLDAGSRRGCSSEDKYPVGNP
jgi:signal transduction histidine kinase